MALALDGGWLAGDLVDHGGGDLADLAAGGGDVHEGTACAVDDDLAVLVLYAGQAAKFSKDAGREFRTLMQRESCWDVQLAGQTLACRAEKAGLVLVIQFVTGDLDEAGEDLGIGLFEERLGLRSGLIFVRRLASPWPQPGSFDQSIALK